jgi:hypothetical protein
MTSARLYGKPLISGAAAWLAPAMLLVAWAGSVAIAATTKWVVRTREEFAAHPQGIVMQAEARWPDILRHVLSQ